ncbi:MAG: carboxylating nicotinate-nucleotide diphosphorylase [Chloroflexaceae bacterium]|nr:carboxylating nicotinate-nucleotide diphosphorylase [Chloroflexaceae bacterium]
MDIPDHMVHAAILRALEEDIGRGDLTTTAAIPPDIQGQADIVLREPGVVAGVPLLPVIFTMVDSRLQVESLITDGTNAPAGAVIARISGPVSGLLTAERVALNFVQHLSGIATLTAQYVAVLQGLPTRLLDTRKTTPGLRAFEKYAVRVGGGTNHRMGLYDAVMLKDNHLALLATLGMDVAAAVRRTRNAVGPTVRIEVEVETIADAHLAAQAGADLILLDNMPPPMMRQIVHELKGDAAPGTLPLLEASGGITLETLRAVAETGVDYISVGVLTHSVRSLDIGMDWHS